MKGTIKFLIGAWILISMLTYESGNYTKWNAFYMLTNLVHNIRAEVESLAQIDTSGVAESLDTVRYDLADLADEVSDVAEEVAE